MTVSLNFFANTVQDYERRLALLREEIESLKQKLITNCKHDFEGIPMAIKCRICGYYRS